MDKKSFLGFALIIIIISAWMYYNAATRPKFQPEKPKAKIEKTESLAEHRKKAAESELMTPDSTATASGISTDSLVKLQKYGPVFARFASAPERFITVETDLYKAVISTRGMTVRKWFLKKYKKWDFVPTQLIKDKRGVLGILLTSRDSKVDTVDTRNLNFQFENPNQTYYKLSGKNKLTLTASIKADEHSSIVRKITFINGEYIIDENITMNNMEKYLRLKRYELTWTKGLAYQEHSTITESDAAEVQILSNGEINKLDAKKDNAEPIASDGTVDYVGMKIKYFGNAIIPQPYRKTNVTVEANGAPRHLADGGSVESYNVSVRVPYDGGVASNNFRIFIGPLEYNTCRSYGIQSLVYLGWRFLFRPIAEFVLLPFFKMLYSFIGNYGITIILFSIVIKFILFPLSVKQLRSTQKMKLVNPVLTKVREQYKDDQKKIQEETMKVYSEYGINPAGGCWQIFLQLPILYALFAVLNNAIDLRQQPFIWWINDLSQPDIILNLPFSLFGIKFISGLALIMGITMFLQQKMTITDPKQKSMVYMMPIMFTLMFAALPSGLNLYYFIFNLLSIGQQVYLEKFSKTKLTLADLKATPKKEGWMAKKMREAQELAGQQGKLPPGTTMADLKKQQEEIRRKKYEDKRLRQKKGKR